MRATGLLATVVLAGLLTTSPAHAEDRVITPPYDDSYVVQDANPGLVENGTATADPAADRLTGALSVETSSQGGLPVNSTLDGALAFARAGVSTTFRATTGAYTFVAYVDDIDGLAEAEGRSPFGSSLASADASFMARFEADEPCESRCFDADWDNENVAFAIPGGAGTDPPSSYTLETQVIVPEGVAGTITLTSYLTSFSYAAGQATAAAAASATVTAIDISVAPIPTEPPPDWILVKGTAGPEGAEFALSLGASAHTTGDAATIGFGFGSDDGSEPWIGVYPIGGGPFKLTTTKDAGSLDVEVADSMGSGAAGMGATAIWGLDPGESIGILIWGSDVALEGSGHDVEVTFGALDIELSSGRGSMPLLAADPSDTGAAVGVGPAAAGMSGHDFASEAGLVGAFVGDGFCVVCAGTWQAPGASPINWSSANADAFFAGGGIGFNTSFAGPAGDWSWSWSGAGVARNFILFGQPIYGSYAPIGDDWKLFEATPFP